jgi:hypothetical protein
MIPSTSTLFRMLASKIVTHIVTGELALPPGVINALVVVLALFNQATEDALAGREADPHDDPTRQIRGDCSPLAH